MRRTLVLSALAMAMAGLVWAAEPINLALQGGHPLGGVQLAQVAAPAGVPAGAGTPVAVPPAPAFTPAADPMKLQPYDRVLGSPKAPITIIEYASLTCSHCRDFHVQVMPQIQQEWIMTGRARYVLRDLPWDNLALGMSAVARCAPAQSFYPVVGALFKAQEAIYMAEDKIAAIAQVTRLSGLDRARVEACIRDPGYQALASGMKVDGQTKLGIKGTPTFFVNGERIDGFVEYKDFKKVLDKTYGELAR